MAEELEERFDEFDEELGCLAGDGSTDVEVAMARGIANSYVHTYIL